MFSSVFDLSYNCKLSFCFETLSPTVDDFSRLYRHYQSTKSQYVCILILFFCVYIFKNNVPAV